MAINKYKYYLFNQKADFGTVESTINRNTGMTVSSGPEAFKASFTMWFAPKSRSLSQTFQATAAGMSDSRTIIVRHNPKITQAMKVRLPDNSIYRIDNVSIDDTATFLSYDFVTITKENTKVGT